MKNIKQLIEENNRTTVFLPRVRSFAMPGRAFLIFNFKFLIL